MTFDELWRLDLARKRAFEHSTDVSDDVHLFATRSPDDSAPDELDEGELGRFLEWLEKSMQKAA